MDNHYSFESLLTVDMPMMLRNIPDPKYNAVASRRPIPIDSTNAVETEGNCILSAVKQLHVILFSLHTAVTCIPLVYSKIF